MATLTRCVCIALVSLSCLFLSTAILPAETYYVSLNGQDANDGKSPQQPWRTVTHAAAKAAAGDTVFIKAGLYRGEQVVLKNSGAEQAPIVFQGYKDQPGDTPDPKYRPGDKLDPAVLPVLEGEAGKGFGIRCEGKSHITIRNLGLTSYVYAIFPVKAQHLVLENVYAVNLGSIGVYFIDCANCTARNCVVTDAADDNLILMRTHHSMLEDCKTYGVVVSPPAAATDYYIVLCDSHDNVVRRCLSHNLHPEHKVHPGHGIGIKDQARADGYPHPHSYNNKIIDCVARNNGENFFVAHEAHHNEFINCTVHHQWRTAKNRWNEGINIRDGAHDNVFRNCRVEGSLCGVAVQDTVEGPKKPDGSPVTQICRANTLVNCVFTDLQCGLEIWNASDNLVRNCVIENVEGPLFRFTVGKSQGTVLRNSIVANVRGAYQNVDKGSDGEVRSTCSDFWRNAFDAPSGAGNMAKDPLFADAAGRDFHLKSQQGRWDKAGSSWVKDAQTSPCIDAGDPSDDYSAEPQPNGARINIGAYGGTVEASQTPAR